MRRQILVPALSLVLSMSAISAASAHAHMETSSPADGARLTASPDKIAIELSEAVEPAFSHLVLRSSDGREVPLGPETVEAGKQLTASPSMPLPCGHYTLDWSVLAVDGHRTSGSMRFEVKL